MSIDVGALVAEVLEALKGEVGDGFDAIRAFAERQSKLLATQAAMIAQSRADGTLRHDDDLFAFFLEQLETMTANFARSVAALTVVTLEKAWNAVAKAVWGAINGLISAAGFPPVPVPGAPAL